MSSDLRKRRSTHTPQPAATEHNTTKKPHLLNWDDLPNWRKDNEYIRTGFRPLSHSYLDSFRSCFYLHNETGNIYSHLLAMIWMLVLAVVWYLWVEERYLSAGLDDCIVFGGFFLGGAVCFGLSTAYHVFANHSKGGHDVWHRLDLLGISTVTAGCFPPGMWYAFPCLSRGMKMSWVGLDLIAQFFAAVLVLFVPRFRQPAWRPVRAFLFTFMASSAFYPIIYASLRHGYAQMDVEAGAGRYALTVFVYLVAVAIYGMRIPERWKPGGFDYWGQSHQIFHILMAVGLTVHFSAFAKGVDYTHRVKLC